MSDLISRSELIKFFKEHMRTAKDFREIIINIIPTIENQPTAYSVEKVVEELEESKGNVPVNRLLDDIIKEKPKELGQLIAYDKAIEIVKQGGISDDVCECRRLKDCKSLFETSCGYIFAREGFKYCPYCGKKIKVVGD